MTDQDFFEESTEQSQVKAKIVHDYFCGWSKVILGAQKREGRSQKISYIDLFAGPGIYKDGRESTPILILKTTIEDPSLSESLISIFNDKNKKNATSLETAISSLPKIDNMKTRPVVRNLEVGQQIVEALKDRKLIPTLLFVDPWGYKGLTLDLLNAVLKDWGCDCIFFFNYNRINMGLANPSVDDHMDALFGQTRAANLRRELLPLGPKEREDKTLKEIELALKETFGKFFVSYRFLNDNGSRATHHLIFASKNFKGYELMRHIMGTHSSSSNHGVPAFEYQPPVMRDQMHLDINNPIAELESILMKDFQGRSLRFGDLYQRHSVGKKLLKTNYQQAILNLEERNAVTATPSQRQIRKGKKTLSDTVLLSFPS